MCVSEGESFSIREWEEGRVSMCACEGREGEEMSMRECERSDRGGGTGPEAASRHGCCRWWSMGAASRRPWLSYFGEWVDGARWWQGRQGALCGWVCAWGRGGEDG
eukprot:scaffold17266_cov82-Isochrysis_galbana.AAC.1